MGKSEEFGVFVSQRYQVSWNWNVINIETTFDLLKSKHILTME